jgi:hypothetical protein
VVAGADPGPGNPAPLRAAGGNFGEGVPEPAASPTTPAGAAHLALSLVIGEQAQEFVWSVVAPRLNELSEVAA